MAQRRLQPQQSQISERLDKVTGLVDETIQTVRRIAADLRPGILDDFGSGAATEWQLEEFGKRTGIHCQLTVQLDEQMLGPILPRQPSAFYAKRLPMWPVMPRRARSR